MRQFNKYISSATQIFDGTNSEFGNIWICRVLNGPSVEVLLQVNETLVILAFFYSAIHFVENVFAAFMRLSQQLVLVCVCYKSTAICPAVLHFLKLQKVTDKHLCLTSLSVTTKTLISHPPVAMNVL